MFQSRPLRCSGHSSLVGLYQSRWSPASLSIEYLPCQSTGAYWAIVDKGNLHHRLEDTIFDSIRAMQLANTSHKIVIELLCELWLSSSVEIRLVALLRVCHQGKLRDTEDLSFNVL